jgi:hypothetical protein
MRASIYKILYGEATAPMGAVIILYILRAGLGAAEQAQLARTEAASTRGGIPNGPIPPPITNLDCTTDKTCRPNAGNEGFSGRGSHFYGQITDN